MKRSHQLFIGAVGLFLVSYFAWVWFLSPQAQVERFLNSVAEAAEDKDTGALLESFSRDYSIFEAMTATR